MDFLRKSVEQYDELERRHAKLQKKYIRLKAKKVTLEENCDKVHRKKSVVNQERNQLEDQLESLQRELDECIQDKTELRYELTECELSNEGLQGKLRDMEYAKDLMENARDSVLKTLASVETDNSELKAELLSADEELKTTQLDYESMGKEKEKVEDELYDLKRAFANTLEDMEALKADKKKLEDAHALLKRQHAELEIEHDAELRNVISDACSDSSSMAKANDKLEDELYDLKRAHESALQWIETLRNDKKKMGEEQDALKRQYTELELQLCAKEESVQSEKEHCLHLQACLDEAEMKIDELKAERKALKKERRR
jgi:chromosome segregation ATPase